MHMYLNDMLRYQLHFARYCCEMHKRNLCNDYNSILPSAAVMSYPVGAILCCKARKGCSVTELFKIELLRLLVRDKSILDILSQPIHLWMDSPFISQGVSRYLYDGHPLTNISTNRISCANLRTFTFSKLAQTKIGKTLLHCYHIWHTINTTILGYFGDSLINWHTGRYVEFIEITSFRYMARNDKIFDVVFNHFAVNVIDFAGEYARGDSWNTDEGEFAFILYSMLKRSLVSHIVPWLRMESNKMHRRIWHKLQTDWTAIDKSLATISVTDDVADLLNRRKEYQIRKHRALRAKCAAKIPCGNAICRKINEGNQFKVCGKCKIVSYCSRKCQKYDWTKFNHRALCRAITDSDFKF